MSNAKPRQSAGQVPKRPQPKGGSRKGRPNKVTKELKDMILGALDKAGGEKYLQRQADENPSAFLTLIGKVLPTTLQGTGPDGAHKTVIRVEFVSPTT